MNEGGRRNTRIYLRIRWTALSASGCVLRCPGFVALVKPVLPGVVATCGGKDHVTSLPLKWVSLTKLSRTSSRLISTIRPGVK